VVRFSYSFTDHLTHVSSHAKMNDPQALFYLLPYTPAAVAVAHFPENAHNLVDAGKVNGPTAREEQVLPLITDKGYPDCDSFDPEPEASDADSGAVTREGTPTTSDSTYRDKVLRFGFDGIRDANGFIFGRDSDSHLLLVQPDSRGNKNNYGISRLHFRIHFNLENGMLMLTDSSTFRTLVGSVRLKRESTPLLLDTTIYCGTREASRLPHSAAGLYWARRDLRTKLSDVCGWDGPQPGLALANTRADTPT